MESVVTLAMLQELGACSRGKIRFIDLFGESVVVSPEIITPLTIREIDWGWAAEGLLPWEIYVKEYLRRMDPHRDTFYAAVDKMTERKGSSEHVTAFLPIRDDLNRARAELFVELVMEHGLNKEINSSPTKEIENGNGDDHQGSHVVLQHGGGEGAGQGMASSAEGPYPG